MNVQEQEKHERNMRKIQGMRLMDDDFMKKCFEDQDDCVELVLRIIMDKSDLQVISSKTEYVIKNLQGRSVRLDIKATDSEQKKYDIEVQRSDSGAGQKRARHNSSMLDANALKPMDDVSKLPETYVIFITENDVLGAGEPLYRIERKILENDELFNDGSHIIYVNGAYRGDSDIGKLIHDFFCIRADEMFYGKLANRVRYFKEDERGIKSMSKIVEDMCKEAALETSKEIAKKMLTDGNNPEKVAEYVGLTLDEIKNLSVEVENINS